LIGTRIQKGAVIRKDSAHVLPTKMDDWNQEDVQFWFRNHIRLGPGIILYLLCYIIFIMLYYIIFIMLYSFEVIYYVILHYIYYLILYYIYYLILYLLCYITWYLLSYIIFIMLLLWGDVKVPLSFCFYFFYFYVIFVSFQIIYQFNSISFFVLIHFVNNFLWWLLERVKQLIDAGYNTGLKLRTLQDPFLNNIGCSWMTAAHIIEEIELNVLGLPRVFVESQVYIINIYISWLYNIKYIITTLSLTNPTY
jgi:hypothetical protein